MDKRLKKNLTYTLFYQILVVLIPIFVTPIVARTLGPKSLGIYDYCFSSITIISTICLVGIGNYGNRQVAYKRDDKEEVSNCFFSIMALQLLLGVLAIMTFALVVLLGKYQNYMSLFIVWIVGNVLDCTWFYLGIEEMKYAVIKNISAKFLYVIAILVFIKTPQDLSKYILFFGMSVLVANIAAYKKLTDYLNFVIDIKLIRKSLITNFLGALKLFLPTVATQILLSIDKVILGIFVTDISIVSFYSNSEKIIQIPLALITVINAVMMPRLANEFSNNNIESIKRYVLQTGRISLFFAFPLMVGIFVCSDYFIPWYLGDAYQSCILILKLLAPIVIGNVLIGLSGNQYFVATNQTKILLIANGSSAIVNIILDVLLIPIFGMEGVCIATVISIFLNVAIQYYVLNKQIELANLYLTFVKCFFYSIIMGGLIIICTFYMEANIKTTVLQIIIGVLSYFGVNFIFKEKLFHQVISVLKGGK